MKKLSMIMLTVLLIASLFISCDNSTKALSDELVEVRIGTGSGSRGLNATVDLNDETGLEWHYSASKVTEKQFKYGETSDTVLTGTVTLSMGKWDFGLWALKDGKMVYSGTVTGVLITKTSDGLPTPVVVPVSPYTGEDGTIKLTGITIHAKTDGETPVLVTPNYAKIDNTEISGFNGTADAIEVATGSHSVTVAYKGTDGVTYASETIYVTVYSGRETLVTGFVSEETGSADISHKSTVDMKGFIAVKSETESTNVEVNVTPSMVKDTKTTVTFPANSFTNETEANAVLTVNVKPIDSNFSVGVADTATPVAGIDIALLVGNKPVTEFNNHYVTITTFIAKGLSNVKVYYNGQEIEGSNYNEESGLLTFTTKHFSEFYVGAEEFAALNATQNYVYSDIDTAVTNAESDDVIKLFKSSTGRTVRLNVDKSLTIEGVINNDARPTISMADGVAEDQDRGVNIDGNDIFVTLRNLIIDTRSNSYTSGGGYYYPRGVNVSGDNVKLLIDNCYVSSKYYALNLTSYCANSTITVQNSTLVGYGAVNEWASNTTINLIDSDVYGINKYTGSSSNFSTICVEADTTLRLDAASTNSIVNISNCNVYAAQLENGCVQSHVVFNALNSTENKVNIDNQTKFYTGTTQDNDSDTTYSESSIIWLDHGTYNRIILNDVQINTPNEYNADYSYELNGLHEYHTNFNIIMQDEWLYEDDEVDLLDDILLTEDLVVVPYDANYILNMNGYTISGANLIVNDSFISDTSGLATGDDALVRTGEGKIIVETALENGTYSYSVQDAPAYTPFLKIDGEVQTPDPEGCYTVQTTDTCYFGLNIRVSSDGSYNVDNGVLAAYSDEELSNSVCSGTYYSDNPVVSSDGILCAVSLFGMQLDEGTTVGNTYYVKLSLTVEGLDSYTEVFKVKIVE